MLLTDPHSIRSGDQREAERAFDALFLRQLLQASGAFEPKEGASPIFADLIVDSLAHALARADGPGGRGPLSLLSGQAEPAPSAPGAGAPGGIDPATLLASPRGSFAPGSVAPPASERRPAAPAAPPFLGLERLVAGPSSLTSAFGTRIDPLGAGHRHHHGVDLAAPEGSTIVAAAGGVVRSVGERGAYGQAVEIDHGGGITTLYAHASELLVAAGERVSKGQPIAKVGQTGRATGPHLHFELRVKERPVNPSRALKAYADRPEEKGAALDPRGPRP